MEALSQSSDWKLDEADALQGLTSRQYRMATFMFQGLSELDAYRQAGYGDGGNYATASKRASEMAKHPRIQAKLRELREKVDEQSTLVLQLSRDWILEGIMGIAQKGDKDSTRLNAYVHLGKVAGIDLFRETTRIEKVSRTPEELDAELQQRLAEMAKTIEAKANPPVQDPKPRDRRRKPST